MDEATSSVDTLTEALIQKGMEALMKGRTSFVIAHRLSTICRANRILVIEHWSHCGAGYSRRTLARARGHYYRLYTQQFRHELEVQYGVADENVNERENVSADLIVLKRERNCNRLEGFLRISRVSDSKRSLRPKKGP